MWPEKKRGFHTFLTIMLIILLLAAVLWLTFLLYIRNMTDINDGSIGVNVTTGKLKVDIVDETQNSLVGDVLDFVDPDGDGELYFEPGVTFYTQGFQVKNVGNIALNYRISISEDENIDRTEFEEAFEFWVTTDPTVTEGAVQLQAYEGALEANQNSETYYIVVKMKESAANEFQGKTYTGFGITVHATQSESEK